VSSNEDKVKEKLGTWLHVVNCISKYGGKLKENWQGRHCHKKPSGFTITLDNVLQIKASIIVRADLTLSATLDDRVVPKINILHRGFLPIYGLYSVNVQRHCRWTAQADVSVAQPLAQVKSRCWEPEAMSVEMLVEMAVNCLKSSKKMMDNEKDDFWKLQFLIKQLQLITLNKYRRNYSPQLTVSSFMINSASSAAYAVLWEKQSLCHLQILFEQSHVRCLMVTAWMRNPQHQYEK